MYFTFQNVALQLSTALHAIRIQLQLSVQHVQLASISQVMENPVEVSTVSCFIW